MEDKTKDLFDVVTNGDFNTFSQLIKNKPDIMVVNENGLNILHVIIENNHYSWFEKPEFLKLITPELIHLPDKRGYDAIYYLLFAFFKFSSSQAADTIEKLLTLGISLPTFDSHQHTPLAFLYKNLYDLSGQCDEKKLDSLNALTSLDILKTNKKLLEKYNAFRKLFVVFGGRKLIREFSFFNEFNTGGYENEAINLLQRELKNFISLKYPNENSMQLIEKTFTENYFSISHLSDHPQQVFEKLLNNQIIISASGSIEHLIGISLQKEHNDIILSIADRGDWGKILSSGKMSVIKSISFPYNESILTDVLKKLSSAYVSQHDVAKNIIFEEIPLLTKSSYKNTNSSDKQLLSRPYKAGLCYFANFKSSQHDLLFKIKQDGLTIYKEYDIYLREKVFSELKKMVPVNEQIPALNVLCENIIREKKKKIKIQFAIANDNMEELSRLLNLDNPHYNLLDLYNTISCSSNRNLIEWLKNTGFDINYADEDGHTLLELCIKKRDLDTFVNLVKNGADLNIKNGNSPLHLIFYYLFDKWFSEPQLLELLTPQLINAKDEQGKMLLHAAVKENQLDSYLNLIKKGGDDSIKDHKGSTPLMSVISNKRFSWFKDPEFLALLNSEKINNPDRNGNTLLHSLFETVPTSIDENISTAEKLIELGANTKLKNHAGLTPFTLLYKKLHPLDWCDQMSVQAINQLIKNESCKIRQIDLNKFNALRQLFVLFGGNSLGEQVGDLDAFYPSGTFVEGWGFLSKKLQEFININHPNNDLSEIYNIISNQRYTSTQFFNQQNECINAILSGKCLITTAESASHLASISFERQKDDVILSIAECGKWATVDNHKKVNAIRSLRFPANKANLCSIITLLNKASLSGDHQAQDIIFKQIPATIGAQFTETNSQGTKILTTFSDNGIDFISNPKVLLKDLFFKQGTQGKQWHNEFNLFLLKSALENYLNLFPAMERNEKLVKLCQENIAKREKKLLHPIIDTHQSNLSFFSLAKSIPKESNVSTLNLMQKSA